MEKAQSFGESAKTWIEDDLSKVSTSVPEIISEEIAIGTLVIIIISAIVSITLLFVMAIFIDCRQQKLAKLKQRPRRRLLKITLPRFSRPNSSEDKQTFADQMHTEEPSSSPATVIA